MKGRIHIYEIFQKIKYSPNNILGVSFFKENVLHDFTTYTFGAQVNQIVNKYLNGYLVFAICFFLVP